MKYAKGSFTTVPNVHILEGKNPILQTIYLWICKYSNQEGICYPSQKTLSEKCGISIDSCRRYIKELENLGILVRERRFKDNLEISSIYALVVGGSSDQVGVVAHSKGGTSTERDKTKSSLTKSSLTKIYIDQFNLFWKEYPNKKSKPKAEQKYISLLKGGTTHDSIMNGLNKYIKEIKFKQTEKKFIKHPYTWLNQGCWDDEYEIVSGSELDNYIGSQDQETQIKIKQKRVRLKTEFNKEMTLSYAQNYVSILEDAKNYVNKILNTN